MVDSIKEPVRIPKGLSEWIEQTLVEEGLFSSRADFISTAIRYYYENSMYRFVTCAQKALDSKEENPELYERYTTMDMVQLNFVNPRYRSRIDAFQGEKVTILLRLPPLLVKRYTRFIKESNFYKNKTDFYNHAIQSYLDAQYYVDSISDAIHHRDKQALLSFNDQRVFVDYVSPMIELGDDDYSGRLNNDTSWEEWLDE